MAAMPVVLLFLFLFSDSALSSMAEFFGAGPKAQALAGQSTYTEASANYYGASTLAFTESVHYSLSLTQIHMNFLPIEDVLTASPINSNQSDTYGDVDTDYPAQEIIAVHALFPFFKFNESKIGASFFIPAQKLVEINTGDAYRPEYSMYRSRFLRTSMFLNYIQPLGAEASISAGLMTGMRSEGETYVVANDSGSPNPSSGKMSFNASPVFSALFSFSYRWNPDSTSYFSFQDQAQSKLENQASGLTPIGGSSLKYNWDMSSMLYFDPRIYRLSHRHFFADWTLTSTLEYQDWSGYESPRLNLKNRGGILVSSSQARNFDLQNTLVPKIAIEKKYETWSWQAGLSHRPSPMILKNHRAGNQFDTDANIASLGLEKTAQFKGEKIRLQLAAQYQQLVEKTVKKSGPRENGDPGDKIGSPSYKGGGNVAIISVGISWSL